MNLLRRCAAAAILLLSGFVVVHSLLANYRLLPLVPYLDHLYLQAVFFVEASLGRENLFPFRLTPSNEHLMLFPMPLYWLDNELFAARGVFLITIIQLVNLGVACLLATVASRAFAWRPLTTAAMAGLIAATQFWSLHGVNLFWPKQVHMYCMLAAFAAGSWLYARAEATRSKGRLAACLLCFTVSLFSFGYGLAAFCGLAGVAVMRAPWRWSAVIVAVAGSEFAFYWQQMVHLPPRSGLVLPTGAAWLQHAAEYVLYFLSSPIVQLTGTLLARPAANVAALVLTGLGVAAALAFLGPHLRRRGDVPPARTFASVWLLAMLVGACITAVSRLGNDPEESRADRYAMIPVAFWNALLLAGLSWLPGRWRERGLLLTGVAVLPPLLAAHLQQAQLNTIGRSYIVAAEMAVLNGVVDEAPLRILHPDFKLHLPWVQQGMKARQWGIFAGPQDEWLDQPFATVFPQRGAAVHGFVLATEPAVGTAGAVRVDGFAFDDVAGAPTWLVLVAADGRIAGVAHSHNLPLPAADAALDRSGWWVGYARVPVGTPLTAYAVLGDGVAAPLAR